MHPHPACMSTWLHGTDSTRGLHGTINAFDNGLCVGVSTLRNFVVLFKKCLVNSHVQSIYFKGK